MDSIEAILGLRARQIVFLAFLVLIGLLPLAAGAAGSARGGDPSIRPLSDTEKKFGVKVISLRPTAAGQLLDLRFQVLDPEKAKAVLDRNIKAYLQDGKTGKTLPVSINKAGSMRQTTLKPEVGRVYFMLFANPGALVKEGGSVSLLIGDFRQDGIRVEGSGTATQPPQGADGRNTGGPTKP